MIGAVYIPLWVAAAVLLALCIIAGWWDELAMFIRHRRMDRQIKKYFL